MAKEQTTETGFGLYDPKAFQSFQTEINHAVMRNIKGVEYIAKPDPSVGLTPKERIYKRGALNLHHYHSTKDEVYRVPILLVMATSNKAYIFDLSQKNSFVRFLLDAGYDVFVIDWEAPRPEEKVLGLRDYAVAFIEESIRRVQMRSGEQEVSLIGYCMGGVLASIYAAAHPEAPVKNLICFTTPVDWSNFGIFAHLSAKSRFDVDRLVDAVGNVPPNVVRAGFEMSRPEGRSAAGRVLYDNLWDDDFVEEHRKAARWVSETLPLAGEYYRETVKELMWGNKLFRGELEIGARKANLGDIKIPVLHAVAEHDDLVPRAASAPLIELVGSRDKSEIVLKGGHVSLIAGANAARRLWPALDCWLGERSV